MLQLIAKQQAADTKTFYFMQEHIGCTLVVDGNLAANTIALNYLSDDGVTATPVTSGGSAVTLSTTKAEFPITYACSIQVVKGITTNAVGINIHGLRH